MIQVCEDRGLEVSPGLAGAALRHAYRTPRHGFDCGDGEALDADEVARLVEIAADALANDRGPAMETIRMQVGLFGHFCVKDFLLPRGADSPVLDTTKQEVDQTNLWPTRKPNSGCGRLGNEDEKVKPIEVTRP